MRKLLVILATIMVARGVMAAGHPLQVSITPDIALVGDYVSGHLGPLASTGTSGTTVKHRAVSVMGWSLTIRLPAIERA